MYEYCLLILACLLAISRVNLWYVLLVTPVTFLGHFAPWPSYTWKRYNRRTCGLSLYCNQKKFRTTLNVCQKKLLAMLPRPSCLKL